MAELKTKKTTASVAQFVASIANEKRRADTREALKLMEKATGLKPRMWGSSIIGFGSYYYESTRSSQKGEWPLTGLSPRSQNLTIYIMPGFDAYASLLQKLGPHTKSKSCLYIKDFSTIHKPSLTLLVKKSVAAMKKRYPTTAS